MARLSKVMRLLWNAMDDYESWKTITHSSVKRTLKNQTFESKVNY